MDFFFAFDCCESVVFRLAFSVVLFTGNPFAGVEDIQFTPLGGVESE